MKAGRLLLACACGLGLAAAALALLGRAPGPARADAGILYVTHDCSAITFTPCYTSIQSAASAAHDGDTIRVAAGVYSETVQLTQSVNLEGGWPADFSARDWNVHIATIAAGRAGPVIQVAGRISPTIEGLVIAGGDSTSSGLGGGGIQVHPGGLDRGGTTIIRYNVITNNVACRVGACFGFGGGIAVHSSTAIIEYNTIVSNVAKLGNGDGGNGGGVYIGPTCVATLTGNLIGDNAALPSFLEGSVEGKGGGVYLGESLVFMRGNRIEHNVAVYGGGLFAHAATGLIIGSRIAHNVAATRGGGLYLYRNAAPALADNHILGNVSQGEAGGVCIRGDESPVTLTNHLIAYNQAARDGGGVNIYASPAVHLVNSRISHNTAGYGGGIFVSASAGAIAGNWITGNVAITRGGGLYLYVNASPHLDANRILSNTSAGEAGGVCIRGDEAPITLTNHIIARNGAARQGGGVYVYSSPRVHLVNNSLVDNNLGSGQEGVVLLREALQAPAWVSLTNNIIVGHSIAVTVGEGCTATLSHNDYYGNAADVVGPFVGTLYLTLDPRFEERAAGDYHLKPASPLIDAGDPGVYAPHDLEGNPRPLGPGPDIGAYECARYEVDLPLVVYTWPISP